MSTRDDGRLPAYTHLEIKQGDDTTLVVTYRDAEGDLVNLTGYEVEFSYGPRDGGEPQITHTRSDEEIEVEDAAGVIRATFTAADTRSLEAKLQLLGEITVTPPAPNAKRETLVDLLIDMRREAVDESAGP
jgi:hypothetical protein